MSSRTSLHRLTFASVAALALWAGCPGTARAEGNRPDLAFDHIGGEIGTGVFCAGTTAFYFLPQQKGTWAPFEARTFDPITGGVSDLTAAAAGSVIQLGLGYLFETGYLAASGVSEPATNSYYAVLVEGESLLLSTGIGALIKRLAGRCRPRAYDEDTKSCDEYDAFPSGHTASAASFAGARLVRTALTPWTVATPVRLTGLLAAEANMVITGALRITSGSHSWEDVVVGGLIGHATGVALEFLHPRADFADSVDGAPIVIPGPTSTRPSAITSTPVFFSFGGSF